MMTTSSMKRIFLGLALTTVPFALSVHGATFVDDRGVEHTWDNTRKARVGVRAGIGAVSLYHMGMRADQLAATWGLWGVRGSDFDPENPAAGSIYPEADPSVEEAAFLASAPNLSPSCWKNPRGCFRWDNITDVLNMREEIDFILLIDNASSGHLDRDGGNGIIAAEEAGMNVIFIDTFYQYSANCRAEDYSVVDPSACSGRSMIDITSRIEELAFFLGVDVDTTSLNAQKKAACEAAEAFTETMKGLHDKGVRVKVTILGTGQDPETGSSFAEIRDFDPIELWVPRTLEELGMPLLHAADDYDSRYGGAITADEYFVECDRGVVNQTCNGNTYFPVDFWLIDSRSFRLVDDNFKLIFPDRAMLANQYWSYPRNDGSLSYVMIESLLNEYTSRLSTAVKVQDQSVASVASSCSPVDPKAVTHVVADGTGGLSLNEFVCYNEELIQKEYLQCPVDATPSSPQSASPAQSPSPPTQVEQDAETSAANIRLTATLSTTIVLVSLLNTLP